MPQVVEPDFANPSLFHGREKMPTEHVTMVDGISGLIGENEKVNIKQSIENIQVASKDFRNILGKNKDDVSRIVRSTAVLTNKMETIVKDVEQGKGTLGLLVKDDALYKDAKDTVSSLLLDDGNLLYFATYAIAN